MNLPACRTCLEWRADQWLYPQQYLPVVALYNLVTRSYFLFIRLAAWFHPTAKLWVKGRRNLLSVIEKNLKDAEQKNGKIVWLHCASLGEFEQGRPVMEELRKARPELRFVLTFFSPSGYEVRKKYSGADWIFYLPADTAANARRFLDAVNPSLAIFVKYEFWFHFLATMKERKVPVVLIAGAFRPSQPFFRWYGALHRRMLGCFTKVLVQQEESARLLAGVGIRQVVVAGDTRVDRVISIAKETRPLPLVEAFCGTAPVLVCGSTWEADEKLLIPLLSRHELADWKFIFAPHDVSPKRLATLENAIGKQGKMLSKTTSNNDDITGFKVLVIDTIGLLAWVYRYAKVAYVGGAFGKGLHNILEPAAYGIPVILGKRFGKFTEAVVMCKSGGAFSVAEPEALLAVLQRLNNPGEYHRACQSAGRFVLENQGATGKLLSEILPILEQA